MAQNGLAKISSVELAQGTTFTPRQIDLIRDQIAPDATPEELMLFVQVASSRGLDPFRKHIYAVKRWDSSKKREVMAYQVSIDGLRLIAQRSGRYQGQTLPQWCGQDGIWKDVWLAPEPPAAAKVGVYIRGMREPLYAVALYRTFVQRKRDGDPTKFWAEMPEHMLAKCFDPDTEILTDRGFQRFGEVTGRVLQVGDDGLEPTDSKPFEQAWSGGMVTLESDDLNFCVTPNHDMVTTTGRIEALEMYEQSRARPVFRIPRLVSTDFPDAPLTDQQIQLAAAYLADGYDRTGQTFAVSVSRERKVVLLRTVGGAISEVIQHDAGRKAHTGLRTITTTMDKVRFSYAFRLIEGLCEPGKRVRMDAVLSLSARQARLFVDTLLELDGHQAKDTGTRKFYTSRLDHLEAFEVAAVAAGYSVGRRHSRTSDISKGLNYWVAVSPRDDIPVIRWGRGDDQRSTGNAKGRTGLEIVANASGSVWCVTVPSGLIVVRRNGFSMLCGNCAESGALRRAFPEETTGIFHDRGDVVENDYGEVIDAETGEVTGSAAYVNNDPHRAMKRIHAVAKEHGITHAHLHAWAVSRGLLSTADFDENALDAMADKIESNPSDAAEWFTGLVSSAQSGDGPSAEQAELINDPELQAAADRTQAASRARGDGV